MKRIYLFALLCLTAGVLKAQQAVVFKVKYLPNHNYQVGVKVSVKLNATLSGDQQVIDKLKSQGLTQPITVNADLAMDGNSKTGAAGADNSFPLNISYKLTSVNLNVNGKEYPIPVKVTETDIKAAGHISSDGKIQIDSANGKQVTDTAQKKMRQMMDLVQKQIQFPEKALKVGDTFTQGSPMSIPITADNKIQIDASVTYKLVSITDGKAYFDMVPNFSMTFSMQKITVNITGTGTGKMVYSIKDNFPLSKEANINMKIKATTDKVNVDGTAAITSSYTGTIN